MRLQSLNMFLLTIDYEGKDQIFKLDYPEELYENERGPIRLYSIAFHGKRCKVFKEDHPAID